MEKITKQIIQDFISTTKIDLLPTQKRLCLPIINRMYRKMSAGIAFSAIKVDGNLIGDGHHRYLAALLANYPIEKTPTFSTSATILIEWESVLFEDEDWDTTAKINMLNNQDAEYNNMPISQIFDLLK
ncbi:hypothetical protein [Parasediminibacterium sp. JCM 36343]|uniref:hypothetical protein n=1 Tax=Parasediminibacterium sp. JCM 36343 TaxID=3374279 RepID=UPI00397952DC